MTKVDNGCAKAKADAPSEIIRDLHDLCTTTLDQSIVVGFNPMISASYGLASDLDCWTKALASRSEQPLYVTASSEYIVSMLNNAQGQYRNAFKGLRLVLELTLEGIYLSANLVLMKEWLNSQADTSWNAILDPDKGVFAKRFCRAFFPELDMKLNEFKTLSETLYREMSECTHGNVPNRIPLPGKIEFDEQTFKLWHEKAATLRYIINFVLTMRYAQELPADAQGIVEPVITDQLSHIESIRAMFGGPVTK